MKVSLLSEVMKVRSTHLVYCNIIVHSKGQFMQFYVLKIEQFCQFISHLKSRLGHVSHQPAENKSELYFQTKNIKGI